MHSVAHLTMKQLYLKISVILICIVIVITYTAQLPKVTNQDFETNSTSFSLKNALQHVKEISKKPHYTGSEAQQEVIAYLTKQLTDIGLTPELQQGYTAGDWANLSYATNIMARIKGSGSGKALLLLSHYDSNPHSSLGAADAGSGVATILEAARVFMNLGKQPKNDIIILFTDSEELGLNGAQLFVNQHKWAKDVGLVLNLEARGSGGPSYMLIETNKGNQKLIEEFSNAQPQYPVANSLMYTVYKMLPNDTDLTVFREDGDINGFNFAFIDDHFDYHTQMDNAERLDIETLKHQATYVMPLLAYFSNSNLATTHANNDDVYFNLPYFGMVYYPFSWVQPMFYISCFLFLIVVIIGLRKKVFSFTEIFKGFIPFLISFVICAIVGYFFWPTLLHLYPGYNDILHGFTYNGHWYIAVVTSISIAIFFFTYQFYKYKASHLIAPIAIWLGIVGLISFYLKGAGFLNIPVLFSIIILALLVWKPKVNALILFLLTIPLLTIVSPFIEMFPVGLGLKMLVAASVLIILGFGLLLPIVHQLPKKAILGGIALTIAIALFLVAHLNSGFTKDTPKPSSLVYFTNADTKKAYWLTYNKEIEGWISKTMQRPKTANTDFNSNIFSSKYHTGFTFYQDEAYYNTFNPTNYIYLSDTTQLQNRTIEFIIKPDDMVNRLELFASNKNILKLNVNGVDINKDFLAQRDANSKIITIYRGNKDEIPIKITFKKDQKLNLTIFSASNTLLTNKTLALPKRSNTEIPMPFVLNDAIIQKQQLTF